MGTSLYERYVAEKGASPPPDDLYSRYLAEQKAPPPASPDKATLARRAAARTRQNANDQEMAAAETPDYATQVTGGIASLAHDIPGAEALQAAIRSASSRPSPEVVAAMAQHPLRASGADTPQTYREARSDIQNAEADAPAFVRGFNRTAGNVVGASSIPGLSPWKAGGLYGVASGLMQSDPDAGIGHRSADAAIKGVLGAAGAKVAQAGTGWLRSALPASLGGVKTLGANALGRKGAMQAADEINYGRAAAEGTASGGTSPEIQATLAKPDIAPNAAAIRDSRLHAGADDATVLREAYKHMSDRQGTLANRVVNANDYKAGTALENADVGLAKKEMLQSADPTMPSFRGAVEQHAEQAGLRDAFRTGADATKRIVSGVHVAGKKLETNSAEAFAEAIKKMKEEAANASLEGVLGRMKEYNHASANPLKLFGLGPSLGNAGKMAPYVHALDQIGGTGVGSDAARHALVALLTRIGLPSAAPPTQ